MRCPKCKETYLQVYGVFAGSEKIEFGGEELEVIDSDPGDFAWEDHDHVVCLGCWHEGEVLEFEAEDALP